MFGGSLFDDRDYVIADGDGNKLVDVLKYGGRDHEIITPRGAFGTKDVFVKAIEIFTNQPIGNFLKMKAVEQARIMEGIEKQMVRVLKQKGIKLKTPKVVEEQNKARVARTELHSWLYQSWAMQPLKLEQPQGSSLHHLRRYDMENTNGAFERTSAIHGYEIQSFVVENDWGKLVPLSKGEWRLPFKLICWEFRISAVRVLAMSIVDSNISPEPMMYLVYGKDKTWVSDDYLYTMHQDGCKGKPNKDVKDPNEFYAVAQMVYANIRASCIMLDAKIAKDERVEPSKELVKKALKERSAPPRTHYVVRLLRQRPARTNSGHTGEGRGGWHQRGHWRPGRFIHYENPDSGQEKYVNDGGFWLSKSWQPWHFAGDLNNIIEKEYRL